MSTKLLAPIKAIYDKAYKYLKVVDMFRCVALHPDLGESAESFIGASIQCVILDVIRGYCEFFIQRKNQSVVFLRLSARSQLQLPDAIE